MVKMLWIARCISVGLLVVAQANAECNIERLMPDMFSELERIGDEGEKRLMTQLDRLTAEKHWSAEQRDQLILEIADSEHTVRAETLRSDMIGEMFLLQSASDIDCEALGKIRTQIIELERAQWLRSVEIVERRLSL